MASIIFRKCVSMITNLWNIFKLVSPVLPMKQTSLVLSHSGLEQRSVIPHTATGNSLSLPSTASGWTFVFVELRHRGAPQATAQPWTTPLPSR